MSKSLRASPSCVLIDRVIHSEGKHVLMGNDHQITKRLSKIWIIILVLDTFEWTTAWFSSTGKKGFIKGSKTKHTTRDVHVTVQGMSQSLWHLQRRIDYIEIVWQSTLPWLIVMQSKTLGQQHALYSIFRCTCIYAQIPTFSHPVVLQCVPRQ